MKMKTGLYWLANIFLPLSEARYTKNKIIPSFAKQLQRMRVAKKTYRPATPAAPADLGGSRGGKWYGYGRHRAAATAPQKAISGDGCCPCTSGSRPVSCRAGQWDLRRPFADPPGGHDSRPGGAGEYSPAAGSGLHLAAVAVTRTPGQRGGKRHVY